MEADGAVVMWQRSIEKYKLHYTSVIADGDAKTYKAICGAKPYGSGVEIEKHECVGHVHTLTIPTEIAPFVKTFFEKFSDDSLIQRCVPGVT